MQEESGTKKDTSAEAQQPSTDLALDVDVARAVHRIVRAMHDGECPRCHILVDDFCMKLNGVVGQADHYLCTSCGFTIRYEEAQAAIIEFGPFMERNLAVFEEWRAKRNAEVP